MEHEGTDKKETEKFKSLGEEQGQGYIVYIQFKSLLKDLVIEHLETIISYSAKKSFEHDIPLDPLNFEQECVPIRIIVNSDGAKFNDSLAQSVWPMWLTIADLPPIKRAECDNMVLANVYYGSGKPDFNEVFEKFQIELREPCRIDTGHRFFFRSDLNQFFLLQISKLRTPY